MTDCQHCAHGRAEHGESGCTLCWCSATANQLWSEGIQAGEALRDEGMERVLSTTPGSEWRDAAYAWIQRQAVGLRFTSIELVDGVGMPPSVNSVGACMNGAGKLGWIENTREYVKSPRKKRHAAVVAVWVRV